jgi:hypothetical protein
MTEQQTASRPEQELTAGAKIDKLRQLFADAPEMGKKALENVPQAREAVPPPVESAGRVGSRLGKVSELTITVPFAPGGAERLRAFLQLVTRLQDLLLWTQDQPKDRHDAC